MNQIKFSHNYFKLGQSKTARLLAVFNTHYDQLGKDFIEYDTAYIGWKDGKLHGLHYPLPHTDLLVLLFQDSDGLFTTVRSQRGKFGKDKEAYYRSKIGEQFEIVITEE